MHSKQNQYLALLRGINVGGKNVIKMTDLKVCFENIGYTNVETFIQSGNVLFCSAEKNISKLIKKTEKALSEAFSYLSCVVIISFEQLEVTVNKSPHGFGKLPDKYKYDVVFLKEPLRPAEAIKHVVTLEGVDGAYTGKDVLYFSRLISKAGQSRLNRIIGLPVYQSMTIRNWNTTTKLLALMKKRM